MSLAAGVEANASANNSKSFHLVGTSPALLNRIQASGPTSWNERVASAGESVLRARPAMPKQIIQGRAMAPKKSRCKSKSREAKRQRKVQAIWSYHE